ncbi:hypothetical protein GEMRC1_007154 [Eukaryota sp. GEM-RC1]
MQTKGSAFESFDTYQAERILRNPNLFNSDPSQFYAFLATVSSDDDEDFLAQDETNPSTTADDDVIVISKRELEALKSDASNNNISDALGPVTVDQLQTLRWQMSSHIQLLIQSILYSATSQSTFFAYTPLLAHLQHSFQLYCAASGFLSVVGILNPRDTHFYSSHLDQFNQFISFLSNCNFPLDDDDVSKLLSTFTSLDPLLSPSSISSVPSVLSSSLQAFSDEEDRLLIAGVAKFGRKVEKLRDLFLPNRSTKDIRSRIRLIKRRDADDPLRKSLESSFALHENEQEVSWGDEDDQKLITLVARHGHDFSTIANHFPSHFSRRYLRNYWCRKLAGTRAALEGIGVDPGLLPEVEKVEGKGVYLKWKCGFGDCSSCFHIKSEVYVHYYRDHLQIFKDKPKE